VPHLARRVILIRAESGAENPLATWTGIKGYKVYSPLDAFVLPPGTAKQSQAAYLSESKGYTALYSSSALLNANQIADIRHDFANAPEMRWWSDILEHQIDLRSGDLSKAYSDKKKMQEDALRNTSSLDWFGALVGLAAIGGCFFGVVFLIFKFTNVDMNVWFFREVPKSIPDDQRKLGAGDLANLFSIYLFLMLLFSLAAGILEVKAQKYVASLSWRQLIVTSIATEFIGLLVLGMLVIGLAFLYARKRGANLAQEIGFNFGWEKLSYSILFGVLGWGLVTALRFPVELITNKLFHNFPDPSNPVMPSLLSTPDGIASSMMFGMLAIIAPITEEFVFRGCLLNSLKLKYGVVPGKILTGTIFGLIHPVGIAQQCQLIVFGIGMSYIAHRKKSLLPSMIGHALQNSYVYCWMMLALVPPFR
jgi:membrane protease YdiL (CAAX protease family)